MRPILEDWFPHISPDGKKLIYIGYPTGTPTHNTRDVKIVLKVVSIDSGNVSRTEKTLLEAIGGARFNQCELLVP